jgi:ketosteroid isomerase-like protein
VGLDQPSHRALPEARPSPGRRYSTYLSAENVEIVRRSMEAFARGDLDAFLADHDPDSEWRTAADEPNPETYRGDEGLRRFAAEIAEAWTGRFDDVVTFEDFIDLGDWVVVPWTARLRGRSSGVEVDVSETYAVRVDDRRIVRVDEYRTTEEAIEAIRPRGG